ncbi:MAG TPA: helix-turn-helix domain-containing protein [Acidimicrobiales bacterium]|nr:helix-turn-helix domain-containing protein [Acidimicrobiales bacterium]
MQIGVVASDGCFASALVSVLDILRVAEMRRPAIDETIPPLVVEVVGARRRVTAGGGIGVTADRSLAELDDLDVVVVPALGTMDEADTTAALGTADTRRLVAALDRLAPSTTVAAACTGVFPLAEAGLLARRRATTSWWLWPAFRRRYPAAVLDVDAMVVTDGRAVTAGAAFAHIDLALTLVRLASPRLARDVARLLVVDERPSQAVYVALDHLVHDDELVRAFEAHVRAHLREPLDIAAVAAELGTSRRTLERRTAEAVGLSPLALVRRLRVERALHLLRSTDLGTEAVAAEVGYAGAATLRSVLRRFS